MAWGTSVSLSWTGAPVDKVGRKASPRTAEETAAILAGVTPGGRDATRQTPGLQAQPGAAGVPRQPGSRSGASPAPRRVRLCSRRLPLAKGSDSRLACSKRTQWELGGGPDGLGTGLRAVALGTTAQGVPAEVSAQVLLPAVTSSSTKPT